MTRLMIPAVVLLLLLTAPVQAQEGHDGMIALFTDSTLLDVDGEIEPFQVVNIYLFYVRGYGPEFGKCFEFKFLNSSEDVIIINPDWPLHYLAYGDVTEGVSVCGNSDAPDCYAGQDAVYLGTVPIMNIGDPDTFTISVVPHPLTIPPAINILVCNEPEHIHQVIGDKYVFNGEYVGITSPTPPRLLEAGADAARKITVVLNEEVSAATAEDVSHYTVFMTSDPGNPLGVLSAARNEDGCTATITVDRNLVEDAEYTIKASGIEDMEGYVILPGAPGSEVAFVAGENVATLLQGFDCTVDDLCIVISWELSEVDPGVEFHVLRSNPPSPEFVELDNSRVVVDGLSYTFRDDAQKPGAAYRYRVEIQDGNGRRGLFETGMIEIPVQALALYQNYPNPFNPVTIIHYRVPAQCHVNLSIYDVSGRLVSRLVDEVQKGGPHEVEWNGRDDRGAAAASGIYFYMITAGKKTITRKMVLMR